MPFEYQFIQREKEQLHVEFIKLVRQLDMKQKLEWEIGQLKGSLTALNNTRDNKELEDGDVLDKINYLQMELKEKQELLQACEDMNQMIKKDDDVLDKINIYRLVQVLAGLKQLFLFLQFHLQRIYFIQKLHHLLNLSCPLCYSTQLMILLVAQSPIPTFVSYPVVLQA